VSIYTLLNTGRSTKKGSGSIGTKTTLGEIEPLVMVYLKSILFMAYYVYMSLYHDFGSRYTIETYRNKRLDNVCACLHIEYNPDLAGI